MRTIQTTGLVIFIGAFLLFNALFFAASYRLTPGTLRHEKDDARTEVLGKFLQPLMGETVYSNFSFIHKINNAIDQANASQLNRYAITNGDVAKLKSLNSQKFSLETLDEAFQGSDDVSSFKRQAFRDFASWLEGQDVSGHQLDDVAVKIQEYGIIGAVGFDKYRRRDLRYNLTNAAMISPVKSNPLPYLLLTFGGCLLGAFIYILPKLKKAPGIRNDNIFRNAMKNGGWMGMLVGTWLILFYIVLYFYPEYMTNWIRLVDPVSKALNGGEASRFFLYGFIYTICILVMGVRMIIHYRHSKYHIVRTLSLMFFQTAFAFLIPEFLIRLNQPYFDFKNIWPLDYDFFFDNELNTLIANGTLGLFMLGWGIALIIIAVPVFVYFFGKRWYCSWVCGCGGLAETLGDPYRQLSNKSLKAWKIERWLVHGVLVFAVVMTAGVLYTYWTGSSWFVLVDTYTLRATYGAWIGAGFAGVIGTGFYPVMGNRVWCRFGCPLAAYLGLVQRFKSRFRITTNGGQCISCGNCSTYCEMGIDVRWYAQRGQNIVRASCVGCGVCSSVCPRGVLKLENRDENGRFGKPILIGNNGVTLDS